jgi:hypothetical protein
MSLITMENKPEELVYWDAAKLIEEWLTAEAESANGILAESEPILVAGFCL